MDTMPRKKKEETIVSANPVAEEVPFHFGVWYVMKNDFSGWELYRRTKETIARCFEHPEQQGRVVYNVFGIGQAGGATTCELEQFRKNIVRVAVAEDAVLPPQDPLV